MKTKKEINSKLIKILLISGLFYAFAVGLFGPIYAMFVGRIGGDILDASGAWATFAIVNGTIVILFGKLGDKTFNKKYMVFFGFLIVALGTLGYLFVSAPIHLFFVQAILGLGMALVDPPWDALYGKAEDDGKEASEWSLWEGGQLIVGGISAIIGGLIATYFGFTTLFITMFIFNCLAAAAPLMLIKSK